MVQPQFGYRPPSWLSNAAQATRGFFEQQQRENAAHRALASGVGFLPQLLNLSPIVATSTYAPKLVPLGRKIVDWAPEALAPLAGQPVQPGMSPAFDEYLAGPPVQDVPTFAESPLGKRTIRAVEPTISRTRENIDRLKGLGKEVLDFQQSRVGPDSPAYETGEWLTQEAVMPALEKLEQAVETFSRPGFESLRATMPVKYEGPSWGEIWSSDNSIVEQIKKGKTSLNFDSYLDYSEEADGARREDLDLGPFGKVTGIPVVNPLATAKNISNLIPANIGPVYGAAAIKQLLPDKILSGVDDRIVAHPGTIRHKRISDAVAVAEQKKGASLTASEVRRVGEEIYPLPPGMRAIGEEAPFMFPALTGAKGLSLMKGLRTGNTLRPGGPVVMQGPAGASQFATTITKPAGSLAARGPLGQKAATVIRGGIRAAEQPLRVLAGLEDLIELTVKTPFKLTGKAYKSGIVPLLRRGDVDKAIDEAIKIANKGVANGEQSIGDSLAELNEVIPDRFSLHWFDDAGNRVSRSVAKLSDDKSEIVRDKGVQLPLNIKIATHSRRAPLEADGTNLLDTRGDLHEPVLVNLGEEGASLPQSYSQVTTDAKIVLDARSMFETEILNVPFVDYAPSGLAPVQQRFLEKAIIPAYGRKAAITFLDETNRLMDLHHEYLSKGADFPVEELSKPIHFGSRSPKLGDDVVAESVDEMTPDSYAMLQEDVYSNGRPQYFDNAMDETTRDGQYLKLKKTEGGRETLAIDEYSASIRRRSLYSELRTIPFKGADEADNWLKAQARKLKGPKVATLYAKLMITLHDDKWALRQLNDMYDEAVEKGTVLRTTHQESWTRMKELGGESALIRLLTLAGGRAKRAETRVMNHLKTEVQSVLKGKATVDDVVVLLYARRYKEISKLPVPEERKAFAKAQLDSGDVLDSRPISVAAHLDTRKRNMNRNKYRAEEDGTGGVGERGWEYWEEDLRSVLSDRDFASVEKAAENTRDYHALLRRELLENEMISKELYDNWQMNHPYYFPLNYLEFVDNASGTKNKLFKTSSSGQVYFDPMELSYAKETSTLFDNLTAISPYSDDGILRNTLYHETRLNRQKVARTFLHMAEGLGLGIEDVTDRFYKTVDVPAKEAVLEGTEETGFKVLQEAVPAHQVKRAVRPLYDDKAGTGFISVYINGERRIYGAKTKKGESPAPVSRDWYNPLFGRGGLIEHGDIPQMAALAWTNRFLKGTYTTYDPIFMAGNLLIDTFTVGVTARILPTAIAMRLIDDVWRWMGRTPSTRYERLREIRELTGADQARITSPVRGKGRIAGFGAEFDMKSLEKELTELGHDARVVMPDKNLPKWLSAGALSQASSIKTKSVSAAKKPLDLLERVGARTESYPREAVFDKAFVNLLGKEEVDRILNLPYDEFKATVSGKVVADPEGGPTRLVGWRRHYNVDGSRVVDESGKIIEDGVDMGYSLMDSPEAKQAGVLSLDSSVNFGRGGSAIKYLNNYLMFLNAALEGTKLPLRALGFNAFSPNIELSLSRPGVTIPRSVTNMWKKEAAPGSIGNLPYYETLATGVGRLGTELSSLGPGGEIKQHNLLAIGLKRPGRGPSGSEASALKAKLPYGTSEKKWSIDDRATTALTLATMLAGYTALQWTNFQKPSYWDTNPRHRNTTFMFQLNDDPEIRDEQTGRPIPRYLTIPHRTREFAGLFGPWNYLLESMFLKFDAQGRELSERDDAAGLQDFGTFFNEVWKEVSPVHSNWFVPEAATIASEVISGEDSYWNRPIVNKEYEKLPPSEQYNKYSNTALKQISDWSGVLPEWNALKYIQSPPRFEHLYSSIFGGVGRRIAAPADYANKALQEWWYQNKEASFAKTPIDERTIREIAREYRALSMVEQDKRRAEMTQYQEDALDKELRNPRQYVDVQPEGRGALGIILLKTLYEGTDLERRFYKEQGGGRKKIMRAKAERKWGNTVDPDEQAEASRKLNDYKRNLKYQQLALDKQFADFKKGAKNGMTPKAYVASSDKIKKTFQDDKLRLEAEFPRSVYAMNQSEKNEWYTDMYGLSNFYPDEQSQVNFLVTAYYAIPTPEDDPSRTWRETYQDRDDFRDSLAVELTAEEIALFDAALVRDRTPEQRIRAEQMRYLADYFDLGSTLESLLGKEQADKLGPELARRWRDYLVAPRNVEDAAEKGVIGTPTKEQIYEQYPEIRFFVSERKRQRRLLIYDDWERNKAEGKLPVSQQPLMDLLLVLWYGEKSGGNPYEPVTVIGQQYRLNLHGN